jgi:hypothetical protein
MSRQLFCVAVFCLFFTAILSIRCYSNVNEQYFLLPDMKDCGPGETCQCAKYRFKCTKDDQACNETERSTAATKWMYTTIAKSTCESLKMPFTGASDVNCCSKNECNKPDHGIFT